MWACVLAVLFQSTSIGRICLPFGDPQGFGSRNALDAL
jgi:hypothetical protein